VLFIFSINTKNYHRDLLFRYKSRLLIFVFTAYATQVYLICIISFDNYMVEVFFLFFFQLPAPYRRVGEWFKHICDYLHRYTARTICIINLSTTSGVVITDITRKHTNGVYVCVPPSPVSANRRSMRT